MEDFDTHDLIFIWEAPTLKPPNQVANVDFVHFVRLITRTPNLMVGGEESFPLGYFSFVLNNTRLLNSTLQPPLFFLLSYFFFVLSCLFLFSPFFSRSSLLRCISLVSKLKSNSLFCTLLTPPITDKTHMSTTRNDPFSVPNWQLVIIQVERSYSKDA